MRENWYHFGLARRLLAWVCPCCVKTRSRTVMCMQCRAQAISFMSKYSKFHCLIIISNWVTHSFVTTMDLKLGARGYFWEPKLYFEGQKEVRGSQIKQVRVGSGDCVVADNKLTRFQCTQPCHIGEPIFHPATVPVICAKCFPSDILEHYRSTWC